MKKDSSTSHGRRSIRKKHHLTFTSLLLKVVENHRQRKDQSPNRNNRLWPKRTYLSNRLTFCLSSKGHSWPLQAWIRTSLNLQKQLWMLKLIQPCSSLTVITNQKSTKTVLQWLNKVANVFSRSTESLKQPTAVCFQIRLRKCYLQKVMKSSLRILIAIWMERLRGLHNKIRMGNSKCWSLRWKIKSSNRALLRTLVKMKEKKSHANQVKRLLCL